jgi:ectoine hydroxylase-related dioxygenase (phytanoyl-CoA dioxygenase family)
VIDYLEQNGFAIVPDVIEPGARAALLREIEAQVQTVPAAGVRGLAQKISAVRLLANSGKVQDIVSAHLGPGARLVRSILFSKSQETNWQVAWHQDLAIAVRERADYDGFVSWSLKDGIVHVQPPEHVLERMLTVRIHLDPADESNGALWVVPASHRLGRVRASDAASVAMQMGQHVCAVKACDALLFKPLILHASRKATSTTPRRVVHFEFAAFDLPSPLQWSEVA